MSESNLSDYYTHLRVESTSPPAITPIRLKTTKVPKGWGHEIWVCNNNEFCGKELHINAGHQFSMHFHIKKREVFRLRSGKVFLDTIDLTNADQKRIILEPGDIVEIPRHLPHSIKAVDDSIIDEYSTTHEDSDSYRVLPGSSQKKV